MLSPEGRRHLERYWQLSVRFFHELDFALATFFAITLIEEVGRSSSLRMQSWGANWTEKGFTITGGNTRMPCIPCF